MGKGQNGWENEREREGVNTYVGISKHTYRSHAYIQSYIATGGRGKPTLPLSL